MAEHARTAGNEAQARVCARRAAGLAIEAYYQSTGETSQVTSAIGFLRKLQNDPRADPGWKKSADLLLIRVSKDHTFPVEKDVLAETQRFIQEIKEVLRG